MPAIVSEKLSKTTGILLLLFTISILISQSMMDFFSTLLCLYLGYQWLQARRSGGHLLNVTPKMGFDCLWVAWFAVTAIGFAINRPAPPETPPHFWIDRLVEFKWILILYFMLGALYIASAKESALNWFNGAILFCSGYAIIDYFHALQNTPIQDFRLGGLFQFSMTYAHVYGIFFCCLLGIYFQIYPTLPPKKKIFYVVTITVLGISLLLTYTRGAWIAAFISVITMGFLWRLRNGFIVIVACISLATGLYMFVPSIKKRIDFTAKIADPEKAKTSYDLERVVLWKTNILIFKDHPLFGAGYGQNKFLLHEYYEKQGLPKDQFIGHAHNQYLHLLAGTGVLGLILYVSLLLIFAVLTLKAYLLTPKVQSLQRGLALGALGGQIFFAVGGLTESNFEHAKVRFAIMVMWALGLYLAQQVSSAKKAL